MVAIQVRHVPDDVRGELIEAARREGVSLQHYLLDVLERVGAPLVWRHLRVESGEADRVDIHLRAGAALVHDGARDLDRRAHLRHISHRLRPRNADRVIKELELGGGGKGEGRDDAHDREASSQAPQADFQARVRTGLRRALHHHQIAVLDSDALVHTPALLPQLALRWLSSSVRALHR